MSHGRSATSAGDLLTLDELRALRRLSAWRGAGLVLHAWLVIAATMVLYAAWPSLVTLLVAVVVIGARQLGLAVLMHEASHWLLVPGQRANNTIGTWLCAAPILADLPSSRPRRVVSRRLAGARGCRTARRHRDHHGQAPADRAAVARRPSAVVATAAR